VILKMDTSDWSNGIRYQIFDTRPKTELSSGNKGKVRVDDAADIIWQAILRGPAGGGGVTDAPVVARWSGQPTGCRCRAVQIEPIIITLKAPGPQRLKLEFDGPLSNFAFNFNLRR
jgi:hypothetical protein